MQTPRPADGRLSAALLCALLFSCEASQPGPAVDFGRLRLRTSPKGAKVYEGDELLAVSTPASLLLTPGTHRLKIQADGAQPRYAEVSIDAGEDKELSLRIPPSPATLLNVFSDVVGAEVRINGYKRGRTPLLQVAVKPGPLDLTLTAGSEARSAKAQLKLGEQANLQVNFGSPGCEEPSPGGCPLPPLITLAPPQGRLSLGMKPDGAVFTEGGRRLGSSPLRRVPLPPGSHRLRLLSDDGHYERWIRVEIAPEETSVYRIQLRSQDARPGWTPATPPADP